MCNRYGKINQESKRNEEEFSGRVLIVTLGENTGLNKCQL